MLKNVLLSTQIASSVLLIALVLIQARGTGFGRASAASFSRRGLEKVTFRLTFVVAFLFLAVSILQLYV